MLISFLCLPVEWQEVKRRLPLIRSGIGGVPVGSRPLQATYCFYVCGGVEVLMPSP